MENVISTEMEKSCFDEIFRLDFDFAQPAAQNDSDKK